MRSDFFITYLARLLAHDNTIERLQGKFTLSEIVHLNKIYVQKFNLCPTFFSLERLTILESFSKTRFPGALDFYSFFSSHHIASLCFVAVPINGSYAHPSLPAIPLFIS
jgi:hypothetical protein